MVFHDNFLRDPRTTFDFSSISSSPNVSPSYSTDSTQSGCSQISEGTSGALSAFTFPVVQGSASSLFARTRFRKSRNRTVSTNSSGIKSRLSSSTVRNESSSMEESSTCRTKSSNKNYLTSSTPKHWIMVLGAKGSGKTSITRQFLYDKFDSMYDPTSLDQMYYGEFDINGRTIGFDVQDVSGDYVDEFPSMRKVSFEKADAFIITFALDSYQSWKDVGRLRDMIHSEKGEKVPIVIVGNKSDLKDARDDRIPQENELDASISLDWENGYVQCSAKERHNVNKIFKELLQQSKSWYHFEPSSSTSSNQDSCAAESSPLNTPVTFSSQPAGFDWVKTKSKPQTSRNRIEDCFKRKVTLPALCPPNALTTPHITANDNSRCNDSEVGKPSGSRNKKITFTKSQRTLNHENVLSDT